jgi:hypothetical protein
MFKKQWIFKNGGRPVIYQSDQEFELFSDEIKWRHVRYEPHLENPIDFSWEREWRIKCDSLNVMPANASIIVPSKFWAEHIRNIHDYEEDMKVLQYSVVDELLAEFAREEFIWQFYALDQ